MPAINPISKVRRIYFLIFHCDKQTSLSRGDSFHLIINIRMPCKVLIHIENREMKRSPHEIISIVKLEDMPYEVSSQFSR